MSKVSIIVPVYKVEEFLEECLDSIQNQSFKDIQVILVDDGSPDRCPEICEKYADVDKRFVVIHKENGGPGAARNAGLDWFYQNSDSKYISFVDSDDIISQDYVQILYDCAEKTGAQITHGTLTRNFRKFGTGKTNCTVLEPKDFFDIKSKYDYETIMPCKLFRFDVLKNLRLDAQKLGEDTAFSHIPFLNSSTIAVTDRIIYFYRVRKTSSTNTINNLTCLDSIEANLKRANDFIRLGHPEALNFAFMAYFRSLKNKIELLNKNCSDRKEILDLKCQLENRLKEDLIKYDKDWNHSPADVYEVTDYKKNSTKSKIKFILLVLKHEGLVKLFYRMRRKYLDRKTGRFA